MATESVPHAANHHTTDRIANAAHDAVDQAAIHGARAEERLRRAGDRYSDQSRQALDRITAYIHEHPYTALGWAAAGGFLIGRLLRSR